MQYFLLSQSFPYPFLNCSLGCGPVLTTCRSTFCGEVPKLATRDSTWLPRIRFKIKEEGGLDVLDIECMSLALVTKRQWILLEKKT